MDREWALYEQMRAEMQRTEKEVDPVTDVEARYICFDYVRRQTGREGLSLTWPEYQSIRLEFFRPSPYHGCSRGNCQYLEAKWGQVIADPKDPQHVVSATGIVYVCIKTGQVHVCDDDCIEQTINESDAGTIGCPISGRFKGGLINNHAGFFVSDHQLMTQDRESGKRPPRKRSSDSKRPVSKRRPGADGDVPKLTQFKDAGIVCRELLCSGVLRTASLERLQHADQELRAEVQAQMRRGDVPDAVSLIMASSRLVMPYFCSTARLAQWTGKVPNDVRDYIERCLLWMFYWVRQTPGASEGGNDINLRKMCFALAYILRRGLVGWVQMRSDTGVPYQWGLMVESDPWCPPHEPGVVWERHVFVPAHPGLRNILPDDNALPDVPAYRDEMSKLMRKTRRLENCFCSVLRSGELNVSNFCLGTHMEIRADILCD